jgi:hypothetical protein
MSETKEEIAAQRDALLAEVENLRGQLAAAGAGQPGRAAPAEHKFVLSEGARQELEATGVTNIGGRLRTIEEVRGLLDDRHANVEIADPDPSVVRQLPRTRAPGNVEGVDYVWPSVAPGVIDPAVAGTPGISGPAADTK